MVELYGRFDAPSLALYALAQYREMVRELDIDVALASRRVSRWTLLRAVRARADVAVTLSQADLRVRYGRGSGRLVKWLIDPYALLGVYLLFVTFVVDRAGIAPGLSLACAVVPFQLVISTVQNATGAVHARESIILNMAFDRALIPVATVLTETVAYAASLSLIVLTMAAYGVAPTPAIAWFPVLFLETLVLALGVGFPAALFGLWFRELRAFAMSFTRALFFLSPGLVPLTEAAKSAHGFLRLNPLTGLFEAYRQVFVFGRTPEAWSLLYPAAVGIALLAVFVPLYRSEQGQFAKVVE